MNTLLELAERCEKAIFPCPGVAPAAEVVSIRSAICHLMTGRGYDAYSPDYIGSLDAAMTLVPEGWQTYAVENDKSWRVILGIETPGLTTVSGKALTFALALCAAALRARAASAIEARRAETLGSVAAIIYLT